MPTLAELDVALVLKGAEMVQKGLAGVKGGAEGADKGLTKVKDSTAGAGKGMESLTKISGLAAVGFATLTGTIMGFVRAGLAGTVQGAILQQRWMFLSREVATMFIPTIETVIDYIGQATNWFRNLSVEQQDSYRKWILVGAGALALVAILPKVVAGITMVGHALTVLSANPLILITAGLAAVAGAAIKASLEVQELQRKLDRLNKSGATKEEFQGGLAGAIHAGAPLKPQGDEEKKKRDQALADLRAHKADLERQAEGIRERNQKIKDSPLKVLGAGLVGIFNPSDPASPQSRAKKALELRAEHEATKEAIRSLEKGEAPKFAAGGKPKEKPQLAMLPTHGFSDFMGKFQHAQMAAMMDDPNRQTAKGVKDLNQNVQLILDKLNKMPFPIIR